MKSQVAKEMVVRACRRLAEDGLVVSALGSVSCRVSTNMFVITTAGADFASITPDQVVELRIPDMACAESMPPSLDKGVHAAVYTLRPDAGFAIHTHQRAASAAAALGMPLLLPDGAVARTAHGLPGTKKLQKSVEEALSRSAGNAVLMRSHGVLCFGRDIEEALAAAASLEEACEALIRAEHIKKSGDANTNAAYREPSESVRVQDGFNFRTGGAGGHIAFSRDIASLIPAQRIHLEIYRINPGISAITEAATPDIAAAARRGAKLPPLLYDFAAIVPRPIRPVPADPAAIARGFHSSPVVLVREGYALCAAGTESEARALARLTDKNCAAYAAASLFGKVRPVSPFESALLRRAEQA